MTSVFGNKLKGSNTNDKGNKALSPKHNDVMESKQTNGQNEIEIEIAGEQHFHYAQCIVDMMFEAAQKRGTGISRRSPLYIKQKMHEGKAVIATDKENVVGFCYINDWENGKYVANSGLIVNENYRGLGIAKAIKRRAFTLSRKKFPHATLVGITTSDAVMKINTELGYRAATFADLPNTDQFWKGCGSCVNNDILQRTGRKHCLCTAMIYNPKSKIAELVQQKLQPKTAKHFWV